MRSVPTRAAVVACLVIGVAALAAILTHSDASYRIHAQFADAGQLVDGDLVEVAGRDVGKVTGIHLTDDGLADVELTLSDDSITPLRSGTIAGIRTVGLSAIANRFIDLSPGPPGGSRIESGGVLPTTQTRGVVDLDMLLNAVDPQVRSHIRTVVAQAATAFAKPAANQVNQGFEYLNPAFAQTAALGREVVRDQPALERLIADTATVARTVRSREQDLDAAVGSTATVLESVAGRRRALSDVLARTPAVARQAQATLARLDDTLPVVDPVLRGLRPAITPLGRLLRQIPVVSRNAEPAIAGIRELLPQATAALRPLPQIDRDASPALKSGTTAVHDVLPVVAGLRAYTPDLVGGFFNGFGGATSGYYDANGHYIRISVQGTSSSLPGLIPAAAAKSPASEGYRTGLLARCPGGAEETAPDGSNPWIPDGQSDICDPKDDHRP